MYKSLARQIIVTPVFIASLSVFGFMISISEMRFFNSYQTYLSLTLPRENPGDMYGYRILLNEYAQKNKIEYELKGDEQDAIRFGLIRQAAAQIWEFCDTNTVIKVHFSNNATYGQFVKLMSMMYADRHTRFSFYNSDFYIMPPRPANCEMYQEWKNQYRANKAQE